MDCACVAAIIQNSCIQCQWNRHQRQANTRALIILLGGGDRVHRGGGAAGDGELVTEIELPPSQWGALSDDAAAHLLVVLEVAEHVGARHEPEQPPLVIDHVQPSRVAL